MSPVIEMKEKITNPLKSLNEYGQSVWLDYIRRNLITSGELKAFIEEDGLRGVTSNPAIFEKAITGSTDYAEALKSLEKQGGMDAKQIYEHLAIRDIQDAADVLRPVYEDTSSRDGYVSLEVSPYLAGNTQASITEAKRLWEAVDRVNLMIKIPATPEGIPAIHQLISEGINVNVTLLFSQESYSRVAEAYISGLEKLAAKGGDLSQVASVASFFISRIDSAIDAALAAQIKSGKNAQEKEPLQGLMGKVAIANAKMAYQRYKKFFSGKRWDELVAKGAQTQRILWASTGVKNPNYSDVMYIEELIGPDTVNTIPPATFDAFRHHGRPRASLENDIAIARETMEKLEKSGISIKEVTDKLLTDAVRLFVEAFDKLLNAVNKTCKNVPREKIIRQTTSLSKEFETSVRASLEDWRLSGKVRKLWAHDASLWSSGDDGRWLGWLGVTEDQLAHGQRFSQLPLYIN